MSLAAMGCGGRLLQMERDGSLAVTAHRRASASQWVHGVTGLQNGAEKRALPYSVQTLRVMSVDELRQVERSMLRSDRALQKQVRCPVNMVCCHISNIVTRPGLVWISQALRVMNVD